MNLARLSKEHRMFGVPTPIALVLIAEVGGVITASTALAVSATARTRHRVETIVTQSAGREPR
jgi:hypothetical protein